MVETKAKSPVLILVILIVLALILAGGMYVFLQNERRVNTGLQQQLQDIQAKQRLTEAKLEESKKMISAFEVKLKETQSQIEALNTDLDAEKAAKQESLSQLDKLKEELNQQKTFRADLEQKLEEAQGQIKKSHEQLTQLETKKSELEEKVKELEAKSQDLEAKVQGIELGTIVVSPETQDAQKISSKKEKKAAAAKETKSQIPPAQAEGNVLVVNKDYNFAVLNLGSKEGVKAGNIFSIYHNNKNIGDVKVEKVHESMCAAGFISGNLKENIFEGDKAVPKP